MLLSGCTEARAPTEESAGWAHHPVGYDRLWREKPRPFPKEILRSAPRAAGRSRTLLVGASLRMTVVVHTHCFADSA